MKQSRGMSSTEAWKVACELAPDVFAHIHKDSHRRWSYNAKPKVASAGRKKKVTDIQITELTAFAHSLLQKGAVADVEAKSNDLRKLSRFVALRLVYGSAR
eukprot:1674382-Amphidinium_carterae.1